MPPISRGFRGRRSTADPMRLPPGQYLTRDFPVLSAGPTPHTPLDEWSFLISGAVDGPVSWTWQELLELPAETPTADIHCVTKWSKFDTTWTGVRVRDLFEQAGVAPSATHVLAHAEYGYTANLPLADITTDHASSRTPTRARTSSPSTAARSAASCPTATSGSRPGGCAATDQPGFWERNGYHLYGDPFREQRFWRD